MDSGSHTVNIATYAAQQPDWLNAEPLQGLADSSGLSVDKVGDFISNQSTYVCVCVYVFALCL